MLNKLSVGPPMVGAADLRSFAENNAKKDFRGSGPESNFGKTLEQKIAKEPKEITDTANRETREKSEPEQVPEGKVKKTETEAAKPEGNKKTSGRQQAIKDFMDSFESEFNIPPTRLVEAMAKLDNTQLVQSPEDTAEAVVAELGLDQGDSEKAQAMYASLLTQLKSIPEPKKTPEMTLGAGAVLTAESAQQRALASQGKQDSVKASVDRLNQNFWGQQAKSTAPVQNMMPGLDQGSLARNIQVADDAFVSPAPLASEMAPQVDTEALTSQLKELPPHLKGQMAESISPALLAALAAKQAAAQKAAQGGASVVTGEEATVEPELMDEFQQALQKPSVEAPKGEIAAGPAGVVSAPKTDSFQNYSQQQFSQSDSPETMTPKPATVTKESASGKLLEKADFKEALSGLEGIHGAPIKGETLRPEVAAPVAAGAVMAAPTQAENEAAVKQVMNQAQYLIKNGGGEMKVEMTPEGMGTIHLKVMLQDGKVNMQMSADTAEAKKTIESSLAELKTSLAAQKLSMENVKVDVVSNVSTDTATQNQNNQNLNGQGQQHRETRQFWNQFNENFGSQDRRESFAAMPNLRGYGKKTERDPLQPVTTASRKVEGKGSGLNLVA